MECTHVPSRQAHLMHPPTSPSLVAKARGGRGHRVVHDREKGKVKASLVWLGGREVEASHGLAGPWPTGLFLSICLTAS
jgi:hypothetical protein